MTYVVMDNWVYGLTKKQTSPTSPLGFKSKTDQWGAVDYPINPMKQAIAAGATFVARTTHTNPNHVLQMMEAAMDHDGFSFVECLSECVEFYEGAFDASNPRKGGAFNTVPAEHDVTDEFAAYKLADQPFPGLFGIFYKNNKPTKNAKEAEINRNMAEKFNGLNTNLGNLFRMSDAKTRSISPENLTGEPGKGGMATLETGSAKNNARELGQGWKVNPFVDIKAGETFTVAEITGPGAIQHIWMTPTGNWRFSILRFYWDDETTPTKRTFRTPPCYAISPGTPPMQCLSTTMGLGHFSCVPAVAIA
jgi:hypothetical protein